MSSSKPRQSQQNKQQQQQSNGNNVEFQNQMEKLLELMTNRSQGRIDDDLVEDAVSSLLNPNPITTATAEKNRSTQLSNIPTTRISQLGKDVGHGDDTSSTKGTKRRRKLGHVKTNHDDKNNNSMEEEKIMEDEDDYDNVEEVKSKVMKSDMKEASQNTSLPPNNVNETASRRGYSTIQPKWTGPQISIAEIEHQEKILQQNERQNKRKFNTKKSIKQQQQQFTIEMNEKWNKLEDIPLGRTGAKMMVTFGDNIDTNPQACIAALQGTRLCLQNAIKDARALRRKMKQDYNRAKVMVNLHKAKKKERSVLKEESDVPLSDHVDLNMLFKAIDGYDKITFEPKCGFDDTQLEKLFPEEMNAYWRWRKMHKSYTDSKDDGDLSKQQRQQQKQENDPHDQEEEAHQESTGNKVTNSSDSGDELDTDQLDQSSQTETKPDEWGGHLNDRMAQFDARTERMKEEWYMTFSVVRQGSFLSKSYNSIAEREWEKARKGKGRGKRRSTWENLPAGYVQFLHWIGFDHQSAIPPPNGETTEALAFLGYDFMGKIVEKAIFLRCLEQRMAKRGAKANKNDKIILELEHGEQLSKEDIERALNDSTVGAKPLYSAANSVLEKGSAVQLYFGPGFEDRIEMELEQLSFIDFYFCFTFASLN